MLEGIEDRIDRPHDMSLRSAQRRKTQCGELVLKGPDVVVTERQVVNQIGRALAVSGMQPQNAFSKIGVGLDERAANCRKARHKSAQ